MASAPILPPSPPRESVPPKLPVIPSDVIPFLYDWATDEPLCYRNLWDLAASQLSDKNKACINFSSTTKLDDLLAAVNDKKRECQEKQWTVERGRERNAIVLRDVFTKIATWVEKFVACGDSAVQYDPGHAALPWAAVRFLLKVEY